MSDTDLEQPARLGFSRQGALAIALAAAVIVASVVVGYLVGAGLGLVAGVLLLALPLANWLLRRPAAAVALWLLITPFVVATDGGGLRKVYWLSHRLLPVLALAIVVLAVVARINPERLPRLRWPEFAMAAYVVISFLSVLHTSNDAVATSYQLYDRVVVPMVLYLIVRLARPDDSQLRRVVAVFVFLLLSQTLIGLLGWVAPDFLPSAWQGWTPARSRLGTRTVGSLRHPNVYGTTVLIAGLFLLHFVLTRRSRSGRQPVLVPTFGLALVMAFMTYSRATWLAAIVVVLGVVVTYPRFGLRFLVVAGLTVLALLSSNLMAEQVQFAQNRFRSQASEHSALSRLPVIHASLQMAQARPLLGWGYGNFDRFSPEFQGRVGTFIVPDREHASHNLYLTILAEQGVVGLFLYVGPVVYWLLASRAAWGRLPAHGLISRKLLMVLWLALASHVIVNNYSNMRVVYGLGLWWLILGMIASVVSRYRGDDEEVVALEPGQQDRPTQAPAPAGRDVRGGG